MSTDGTQPPSIAPKKPVGAGVRTAEGSARPSTSLPTEARSGAPGTPGAATRAAAPVTSDGPRTSAPTTTAPRRPVAEDRDGPARGATSTRTTTAAAPAAPSGPRRVRLAVARIDPWSVMKLSFLLSVAIGIMIVVASAVVWYALDALAVFTKVNEVIATLASSTTFFDITEWAAFDRVISLATMIAVVDVVLLTALSTIGAFLYNIVAALVGGIHLTLTDD